MWFLLAQGLAALIEFVVATFLGGPSAVIVNDSFLTLPSPVIDSLVYGVAIFGLFIDLPVLFACVGVVLAWRLLWLGVRLWRILLELIPGLG